jgi:hypothetical protein
MVGVAMEVQKKVTPVAAPRQAQNSLAYCRAHLRSMVKSKNKICEEKAVWPIFELPSVKKKVTTESDLEFMSSYSLLICIIQRFAKKNWSPSSRRVTLTYRASPQKTSGREIYFMAEESMVVESDLRFKLENMIYIT